MSRTMGTIIMKGYEPAADLARRLVLTEITFSARPFPAARYGEQIVEFKVPKRFWAFADRHRKDVVAGQTFRKGIQ